MDRHYILHESSESFGFLPVITSRRTINSVKSFGVGWEVTPQRGGSLSLVCDFVPHFTPVMHIGHTQFSPMLLITRGYAHERAFGGLND